MAWISGLADKAENILNKLDQNAATALSQVPPTASDAMGEMRKSLSSSTLALKTLSPNKSNRKMPGSNIPSGIKSTNDLQQYLLAAPATNSRKSSIDSKDAITITVAPEENNGQSHIATSMSSSFSESQELTAFKIALAEVTSERDALRTHLSTLNNESESMQLRARIEELEMLAHCLNEERETLQQESLKLQTANSAYVHSISELEANLAKLQQEYFETAQKLQLQMKETEQQRQDLQEYRIKAQHTLQMKDNLIAELKSNGIASKGLATHIGEANVLQLENETMRQELDSVKEERQVAINQLEQLREQFQELSKEHTRQLAEMRENETILRKELRMERERALTNESERRTNLNEIYTLRQQYNQHLADAKARLQEKELELQQLKNAKVNPVDENAVKSKNFVDAEIRLKALTQALVDKQNTVELITSEKNALRIQLEKIQEQFSNYVQNFQNTSSTRNALLSNSTDDVKAQFPLLMAPNPFDNRVARRVKRAYSSLDSAGVRLGTFLRRYPLMRVFVLMYVALLHIWVMFVLLSSTPN